MARVAIVTTSYPRAEDDPAGHFVRTEALAASARGHGVTVFAPGPGSLPGDAVTLRFLDGGAAFGFPGAIARLGERPARVWDAARFMLSARRALLVEGPFDRVVAHWLVPCGWPIAHSLQSEREIVVHGSDARLLDRLPRTLRTRIVASLLDRPHRTTFRFVSEELRTRLARATCARLVDASRVEACALDVSGAPGRDEARLRTGAIPSERIGLVVSRLVPSKNPARAVALARERSDCVVVVGDGPLEAELRRAFPAVTFLGRLGRRDTLTWIAAADVVVSASAEEGAPTVIREARALGTPVLAVVAGDLRQWAARDPGIALVERRDERDPLVV